MMQTAQSYDGKTYPECAPYHGARGQSWETFIRDFAAAMSTRDVAEDSLKDTLYGHDVGGDHVTGSMNTTQGTTMLLECGSKET